MLDELLPYYERELGYLRKLSGEFAQRYPKIARRLQLEGEQCEERSVVSEPLTMLSYGP